MLKVTNIMLPYLRYSFNIPRHLLIVSNLVAGPRQFVDKILVMSNNDQLEVPELWLPVGYVGQGQSQAFNILPKITSVKDFRLHSLFIYSNEGGIPQVPSHPSTVYFTKTLIWNALPSYN